MRYFVQISIFTLVFLAGNIQASNEEEIPKDERYKHDCLQLLARLEISAVRIPPFQGSPAVWSEISRSSDLVRWLQGRPGQLYRLDSGREGARIYRWSPDTGRGFVIKAYPDLHDAVESDKQFRLLKESLPKGLLNLIPVNGEYRSLRFYENIQGVTAAEIIGEGYFSRTISFEISRLIGEQLQMLKRGLVERYGAQNVREVEDDWMLKLPDLHVEVNYGGSRIGIWIHDENILFDSVEKKFWIINPE